MRAGLFPVLLLALACASPPASDPAHGAVWGYVTLRPKDGTTSGAGGYGDRRLRSAGHFDYSHPSFAVVYTANGPPPAPMPRTLSLESAADGVRWQPAHAAVGARDRVSIVNHTSLPQLVSAPGAGRVWSLAPGESATLEALAPGELQLHVLRAQTPPALVWVAAGAFALADSAGRFELRGLDPGDVQIRAWHPRLPPSAAHPVTLRAGEVARVDVEIGVDHAERGAP
jgi:hypothetical protein